MYAVYMKRVTGTGNIDLTVDGGSTWTTKTLTSEWQRFWITQAAVTNPSFGVRIVTSGDAIDFWGSEINSGVTFPLSYIPNNSATASVTRNADDVNTSDVSWLASGVGSLYTQWRFDGFGVNPRVIHIGGSPNDRLELYLAGNAVTGADPTLLSSVGGAIQCIEVDTDANVATSTFARTVVGWATDDFYNITDGGTAVTDTSGSAPTTISKLQIGAYFNAANSLNGHIAEIRYYDTRLTNAQLEDMSNGVFPSGLSNNMIAVTRRTARQMNVKQRMAKPRKTLRGEFE